MTIKSYDNRLSTTIIFNGTKKEYDKWLPEYLQNWHPCGYGTRVEICEEVDDTVYAKLFRWNNCD